jgi:hypothetical protein
MNHVALLFHGCIAPLVAAERAAPDFDPSFWEPVSSTRYLQVKVCAGLQGPLLMLWDRHNIQHVVSQGAAVLPCFSGCTCHTCSYCAASSCPAVTGLFGS